MKTLCAAGLILALTASVSGRALAQTDQIIGGFTTVTFSSEFIAYTRESGIAITDLMGNALQSGIEVLSPVEGVIDLQTGVTDVVFKGGFQVVYIGKTAVRVENLILHASRTSSVVTGDIIENGRLLGRQEVFIVNQNPNLSLPLQVTNGILALPTLSLGLSPKFVSQLDGIIGPLVNAGTEVASATPIAVVVQDVPVANQ